MKRSFALIGFASLILCGFAFGEDIPAAISNDEFLAWVLSQVGGLKGLSGIGIAYVLVQAGMKFLLTPMGDMVGGFKLLLVTLLNYASVTIAVVSAGGSWGAALLSSTAVAAGAVFLYEVLKYVNAPAWLKSAVELVLGLLKKK